MDVIIAPDSFKGSLSSMEAAEAIEKGMKRAHEGLTLTKIPIADGGEGTVDALIAILGGRKIEEVVEDPLGRNIQASFGWVPSKKIAVIETAAASGLPLLAKDELNPYEASTYGTGQLLKRALDFGPEQVIIGLGGSATVDAGVGFLQALGVTFLDEKGYEIRGNGKALGQISSIDVSNLDKRLASIQIQIASDVTNPLLGRNGAVAVFGPQKGVTNIEEFEKMMEQYASVVVKTIGEDMRSREGSGAAGGFGFSLQSFLKVEMKRGLSLIADLGNLENKIKESSLVITGEGKIDVQSLFGKVPVGIAKVAQSHQVPCVAFSGCVEGESALFEKEGLSAVYPIANRPMTLEQSMKQGAYLLEEAAYRFTKSIFLLK
ncbi:glycerate kinase [Bacillus songklensis]|uniref:Glycerate kinase n=1 Tax=Bacillus songklensis TaxID=1069116 RepID=A0ABV8B196_9BACI